MDSALFVNFKLSGGTHPTGDNTQKLRVTKG